MAAKITLAIIATVLVFYLLSSESNATIIRTRRDSPAAEVKPSDASKAIDDAVNSLKTGLEDLMKNIQGNELFQNVTTSLKQFGETVEQQRKQLVEKIQTDTKTAKN